MSMCFLRRLESSISDFDLFVCLLIYVISHFFIIYIQNITSSFNCTIMLVMKTKMMMIIIIIHFSTLLYVGQKIGI